METYVEVIKQAVLFFPMIAFFFTMPYIVYNYHKYGSVLSLRILVVYSFILYMICMYFLVILPLPSRTEVAAMTGRRMQLVPFTFIHDILKESRISYGDPVSLLTLLHNKALFQVLFNIVMTIPFGVYLRYYFRLSLKKTVLFTFLLSLFFELTQLTGLYFYYPRSYRLFDVDDLLANTLGGTVGYFLMSPFVKILPTRAQIDSMSYKRGEKVSLMRRFTSLFLDILCIGIMSGFSGVLFVIFLGRIPYAQVLIPLVYFTFLPNLLHGMTIGKWFTKTKIVTTAGEEARWYQYLIRYGSLFLALHTLPLAINKFLEKWPEFHITSPDFNSPAAFLRGAYVIFLLVSGIRLFRHKPLFYEKLSGTRIISAFPDKKS